MIKVGKFLFCTSNSFFSENAESAGIGVLQTKRLYVRRKNNGFLAIFSVWMRKIFTFTLSKRVDVIRDDHHPENELNLLI